MATESTRKHRPSTKALRALHADAAALLRSFATAPPGNAAEASAFARAVHVEETLRWVLGGYAPGMPLGLEEVQATARALREAAAPATEAEVFQGLAE